METETKRYTGFRLNFSRPDLRDTELASLKELISWMIPMIQLIKDNEPFYYDDDVMPMSAEDILYLDLQSSEIFILLVDNTLAGFIQLRDIRPKRSATVEAWAHPSFRNRQGRKLLVEFAKEVYDYAFRPFAQTGDPATEGLGLLKIQAEVSLKNRAAIRAAMGLREPYKFSDVAYIPLNAFFQGAGHCMVLLELYNPDLGLVPIEGTLSSGQKTTADAAGTNVLTAATSADVAASAISAEGTESEYLSAPGADNSADHEPVPERRVNAGPIAEAVSQSDVTGTASASGTAVLPAELDAARRSVEGRFAKARSILF